MNKIIFNVGAKVQVIGACVKIAPAQNYIDTIEKGFDYTGESFVTVTFVNYCTVPFTVPQITLFSDTSNGGNFYAKVDSFTISAGQTINRQVKYTGVFLGSLTTNIYPIQLNGNSATYTLNITIPIVNNPPVASDFNVLLNNRQGKTFTQADFLTHFTDLDGDSLSAVIISGNTSIYTYNNLPLVSGTQIPIQDVIDGKLKIAVQNTDALISQGVLWQAVDSQGGISS